jgi:cytochrome P450
VFMLFAGHDTTKSALQMASMLTARFPEQTALIREQPALVSSAVDEVMRFESPVFMTTRQPAMDLQVGGLALTMGQTVGMGLVSAARDRRGMPDAYVFDIRRTERRSIGFGAGIHFCLGVNLARAELEEAIRGLATRTSSVELGAEPELIPFRLVRQFKELPLNVTPA